MTKNFNEKLKYRFERYINKGGASIFVSLFLVFIVFFVLIFGLRMLILTFFSPGNDPNYTGISDDVWRTWLQMMDPGNMSQDNSMSIWTKVSSIIAGVAGVVILSALIAFITTAMEKVFYNLRKGRGRLMEEDHTLILGWNERTLDIIRELIIANESEKYASVVILALEDKEEMDDFISNRISDRKTTRIYTRNGDYGNINELKRVNISEARSVILLASCSENSRIEKKQSSDVLSIKAIMAIISCQNGKNELPIIAEIFTAEKRELVSFFKDEKIIALDSWSMMGKLLVQTSITGGLEVVYNEILSFAGCEIYFYKVDWRGVLFGELPFHFADGIPLGVYNKGIGLHLNPKSNYVMTIEDQVVILADDDSTINFKPSATIEPVDFLLPDKKLVQKNKKTLIIGWHSVGEVFIRESYDYLIEGSKFDIIFNNPDLELSAKVDEMKRKYKNFEITLIDLNPLKLKSLQSINPYEYDDIIVLSQSKSELKADEIDSDTLTILLLLRNIKQEFGEEFTTNIITQILNSDNQEIIAQTDVDDFIISNKLITMILAQLSEEPLIKLLYDDLFSEEGSEIYVKPAYLYFSKFPQTLRFGDLIRLTAKRSEVCLGIRSGNMCKNSDSNFGVRLNLPKDEEVIILSDDYLVVLSEDEL
tara:strand:- start:1812 stop:3761 length:1950 start_codon:yes stop_codon:yes gene_type:complete